MSISSIKKIYWIVCSWMKKSSVNINTNFTDSSSYWEKRYREGRNSGAGSYNRLAKFKANFLNKFVEENNIKMIVELGCGDGNQLLFAEYPYYIGFDVSETAVSNCRKKFCNDRTKEFFLMDNFCCHEISKKKCDLSLSLDVIYHLVEDDVFDKYMYQLFDVSNEFVVIYSSNYYDVMDNYFSSHVKHRKFVDWIDDNKKDWKLNRVVNNKYPFDPRNETDTSFADFYVFKKV